MCGITGVINFDKNRYIDKDKVHRMTSIIEHRGPDGEGFYFNKNIGLGHRRLSIIDLDTGDQPMLSEDGKRILVFNGEIYNYIEIRRELIKRGYSFRTQSDTEVIMKSYEEWGVDCQKKFNGMWAFALYDLNKEELFVSRDRIGEKPFFYSIFNESFVFGSEIKSLFAYGVPNSPDMSLIEIYLTMTNIPEPYTFFKNVKKLKGGHYLILKNGKVRINKYWDLPELEESNMNSNKNKVYEEFEHIFRDSVKIRMRSDVPFGAFLSGGLDSSSVVSVMSDISNHPVSTFTIGFPEKAFDESKLAAIVAEKFETNHYNGTVHPEDFEEIIDKISYHYDEPFGDSSAIPTGYVSKFARQKVKMVLTGDGGDEVLSGYNSYVGVKITNMYKRSPRFIQRNFPFVVRNLKNYTRGSVRLKLNRMESVAATARMEFNERILAKKSYVPFERIKALTKNVKGLYKVEDYFSDFMAECNYKDDFYKLMYINFKADLPNDYLVKVDRMSMAHSLETRIPFLDYRLIEFMCTVDKDIKLQGWERKSVLRNTIGRTLPKELMNAPKKGFGIPLREWFKKDDFSNIFDDNMDVLNSILDKKSMSNIINDNKAGLGDHGNFIWTLLMLNKALK